MTRPRHDRARRREGQARRHRDRRAPHRHPLARSDVRPHARGPARQRRGDRLSAHLRPLARALAGGADPDRRRQGRHAQRQAAARGRARGSLATASGRYAAAEPRRPVRACAAAHRYPPPRAAHQWPSRPEARPTASSARCRPRRDPAGPRAARPASDQFIVSVRVPRADDASCLRTLEQLHALAERWPGDARLELTLFDRDGAPVRLEGGDTAIGSPAPSSSASSRRWSAPRTSRVRLLESDERAHAQLVS